MQLKLDYEAYQRNSETSKNAYYKKKDKLTLKEQVYNKVYLELLYLPFSLPVLFVLIYLTYR